MKNPEIHPFYGGRFAGMPLFTMHAEGRLRIILDLREKRDIERILRLLDADHPDRLPLQKTVRVAAGRALRALWRRASTWERQQYCKRWREVLAKHGLEKTCNLGEMEVTGNALDKLPAGQRYSLILTGKDPDPPAKAEASLPNDGSERPSASHPETSD